MIHYLEQYAHNHANKPGHAKIVAHVINVLSKMGNSFIIYVVIIPITFLEICVFSFCKVEAENR